MSRTLPIASVAFSTERKAVRPLVVGEHPLPQVRQPAPVQDLRPDMPFYSASWRGKLGAELFAERLDLRAELRELPLDALDALVP
jgi:hypothetical protein